MWEPTRCRWGQLNLREYSQVPNCRATLRRDTTDYKTAGFAAVSPLMRVADDHLTTSRAKECSIAVRYEKTPLCVDREHPCVASAQGCELSRAALFLVVSAVVANCRAQLYFFSVVCTTSTYGSRTIRLAVMFNARARKAVPWLMSVRFSPRMFGINTTNFVVAAAAVLGLGAAGFLVLVGRPSEDVEEARVSQGCRCPSRLYVGATAPEGGAVYSPCVQHIWHEARHWRSFPLSRSPDRPLVRLYDEDNYTLDSSLSCMLQEWNHVAVCLLIGVAALGFPLYNLHHVPDGPFHDL